LLLHLAGFVLLRKDLLDALRLELFAVGGEV